MNPRRRIDKDTIYPALRNAVRFDTEDKITAEENRWFTAGVIVFLIAASILGAIWLS